MMRFTGADEVFSDKNQAEDVANYMCDQDRWYDYYVYPEIVMDKLTKDAGPTGLYKVAIDGTDGNYMGYVGSTFYQTFVRN